MKSAAVVACGLVLLTQMGGRTAQAAQAADDPALAGVISYPDKVLQHTDAPHIDDQFGKSLATSGNDIVVGVPGDDNLYTDDGSAYVYTYGGGAWPQSAKLTAIDPQPSDQFGVSVDVDGDTIVVGAFAVGSGNWGAAYVYERINGVWTYYQKLQVAGLPPGAVLGWRVGVSGDYIALSAYGQGAVYIFQRNALQGNLWGQVAVLPGPAGSGFGVDIGFSGDLLIVGANSWTVAYVYDRALNWALVGTLFVAGIDPLTLFAFSVDISGDTAVIGAAGWDLPPAVKPDWNQGAAFIFRRDQGGPGAWGLETMISASNASGNDQFGIDVDIEGDTAVVGAFAGNPYGSDSGIAYAFDRNAGGAGAWGETNILIADVGYPNQWFGNAVGAERGRALVGAPSFANGGNPYRLPGFAYVFDLDALPPPASTPILVLDGLGGVHGAGGASAPSPPSPYFGFDIAVDIELVSNGYYVLDGFGRVSNGGGAAPIGNPPTPYFGFDIAADLEMAANGYYVLDGYGGVYAGGGAPPLSGTPYFGFDIAVDMELAATGYYVLDGFGGVHAGGGAPFLGGTPYFGFEAAVDMELSGPGYYVLDSFGMVHAGDGVPAVTTPYFGFPVAADLEMAPTGLYVLDGWGGVHAGGGAPTITPKGPYWGYDIARDLELQ